jgi:hypothetical protein
MCFFFACLSRWSFFPGVFLVSKEKKFFWVGENSPPSRKADEWILSWIGPANCKSVWISKCAYMAAPWPLFTLQLVREKSVQKWGGIFYPSYVHQLDWAVAEVLWKNPQLWSMGPSTLIAPRAWLKAAIHPAALLGRFHDAH